MKRASKRRSLLAIVSLLIVACMTLLSIPVLATTTPDVWDGSSVSTDWYTNTENDGTEDNPYEINTAADLAGLASLVNADTSTSFQGLYIVLTKDIDLNNKNWTPIGGIASGKIFKGIFDGQNHTISNLNTVDNYKNNNALFGNAQGADSDNKVEIKNLTINNATLWGNNIAPVAAIAVNANITNVHFTGTLTHTQDDSITYLGAIVSKSGSDVKIENCSSTITYTSQNHSKQIYFGGILSLCNNNVSDVIIQNCSTNLTLEIDNKNCSGDVAFSGILAHGGSGATISVDNCSSTGKITANNPNNKSVYVAGIIAYGTSKYDVTNCTSTMEFDLTNVKYVGGIVARNSSSTAGRTENSITNCYTNVEIKNSGNTVEAMGGIIGEGKGEFSVTNCIAEGDITLTQATDNKIYIGGIVGNAQVCASNDETARTIDRCVYTGNISVTSSYEESSDDLAVGGIAGRYMNGAQIHNSAMYGTVIVNYGTDVSHRSGIFAGAFGYGINGASQKSIITNCLCVFPETTENPVEFEKSGNTTGTTLRAIGGAAMDNNNGTVEAGSIKIIKKTSSDIDMSFEGVQYTAPTDFDYDNNASTPTVKANDIRFVATLGDADVTETESVLSKYSSVGFVITAIYGTSIYDFSQELNHVYTSVKAAGEDVTAADLGGDYIVALTGRNIPAAATDTVTFYVTPKLTTLDGTNVVYGATTELVFVGGVYQQPSTQS